MEVELSSSIDGFLQNHMAEKDGSSSPLLGENSKNGSFHRESTDAKGISSIPGTSGSDPHKPTQCDYTYPTANGVSPTTSSSSVCSVVGPSTVGLSTLMETSTDTSGRSETGLVSNNGVKSSISLPANGTSHASSTVAMRGISTAATQPAGTVVAAKTDSSQINLNGASMAKTSVRPEQEVNAATINFLKHMPPEEQQRLLRGHLLSDASTSNSWLHGSGFAVPQSQSMGPASSVAPGPNLNPSLTPIQLQAGLELSGGMQRPTTMQGQQPLVPPIPIDPRQPLIASAAAAAGVVPMPLQAHPFLMPHLAAVDGDPAMLSLQLPIHGKRILAPKPPGARPRGRPPSSSVVLPTSHPPPIAPAPSSSIASSFFSSLQQQMTLFSQAMAYQADLSMAAVPAPQAAMASAAADSSSRAVSADTGPVTGRQRKPCNCSKSQCLKLYCECFANGEFCSNCNCQNCHNNMEHESERSAAIKACLDRNPHAFHPKIGKGRQGEADRRHNKGCHCRRSGCLKNYCECYEAKIPCSSLCKCVGCKNFEGSAERNTLLHLAQAAEVRTQQQIAARNYLSSQIQEAIPRPMLNPLSGERLPYTMLTEEAAGALCNCLLARASDSESLGRAAVATEVDILEELNHCLRSLITKAGYRGALYSEALLILQYLHAMPQY